MGHSAKKAGVESQFLGSKEDTNEKKKKIIRLPWRGQCGRAAAARALCACCAAVYGRDCTGSPVRF
jgi:hypothetical protein